MPTSPSPTRRTQEERTAATTASVLDATHACLVDKGFARTTVADVAERAGVSRSAVLYHYRSKEELLLAAIEHVMHRNVEEVAAVLASLPGDDETQRLEAAIDVMWSVYRGPGMVAWLELALAARSDPALHNLVVEHSHRFDAATERAWADLFPPSDDVPDVFYEAAPIFLHALLQGLATDNLGRDAADAEARVALTIVSLKLLLRLVRTVEPDDVLAQLGELIAPGGPADESSQGGATRD